MLHGRLVRVAVRDRGGGSKPNGAEEPRSGELGRAGAVIGRIRPQRRKTRSVKYGIEVILETRLDSWLVVVVEFPLVVLCF